MRIVINYISCLKVVVIKCLLFSLFSKQKKRLIPREDWLFYWNLKSVSIANVVSRYLRQTYTLGFRRIRILFLFMKNWKKKNNAKFTPVINSVISAENDMKGEEKIDKNYGIAIRIDNKWWLHNNFRNNKAYIGCCYTYAEFLWSLVRLFLARRREISNGEWLQG